MMTLKEIEAMQSELESNTTDYRHTRDQRFFEIAKAYEEEGEQRRADQARMDATAFALHHHKGSFPGYFQPIMEMPDRRTYPPLDFFTDERLKYYGDRARKTRNCIHASRFADVAWDLSRKKDPKLARIAIDNYLTSASVYKSNGWGVEFGEAIRRAVELAILINDTGRLANLKGLIIRELKALDKDQDYRFCLDLANALVKGNKIQLTKEEQDEVLKIIQNGAAYYQAVHAKRDNTLGPSDGPNEHLVRSFVEAKARLLRAWHREEANIQAIKKEIAESYEREANLAMQGKNALAGVVFLSCADKLYGEAGLGIEQERIRALLEQVGKMAEADMKPVEAKVEIKQQEIDEYVSPLLADSCEESLQRLAVTGRFVPSIKTSKERVEEQKKQFPLQFLFSKVSLKEGHIIGRASSDTELLDDAVIRDFCLSIQIGGVFLARLIERLKGEQQLDTEKLVDHFRRWGYCGEQNIELIKIGFTHYFNGDYISALHVLVPQFEAILRILLEKAGRPVSDPQRGAFVVLGSLLEDPMLNQIAGPDLIAWYKLSLEDPNGLNLRNEIAHGLCSIGKMTKENTELVIHLLLSLTRFRIENKSPETR